MFAGAPPSSPETRFPTPDTRSPEPDTRFFPFAEHKAVQMHDAYLVVETPDGVLVIDQHALHERILFEQLRRRMQAGPIERQRLLVPEPIDLTAEQAAKVLEQQDALAELGLEVGEFGGGTIVLSSYPAILTRAAPAVILRSVVDRLIAKDRPPSREALLNDLLASMACRAAVKAGDRLSPDEIAELLAQARVGRQHAPLPARPTDFSLIQPAGVGPAVPQDVRDAQEDDHGDESNGTTSPRLTRPAARR